MEQLVQIAGAVLILIAFAGTQFAGMSPHSRVYLVLNAAGAAILTGVAFVDSDWGFFMLESVWTLVSLWGLVQVARGLRPA